MPTPKAGSKNDIVNLSLDLLGQSDRVSSIDTPTSQTERIAQRWYDITLLGLLEMYDWNFAIKRAVIPRLIQDPNFGEEKAYQLPSDFISFVSIGQSHEYVKEHKVEGDIIYFRADNYSNPIYRASTNYNALNDDSEALLLRYVSKVEDVSKYSPLFIWSLSHALASNMCFSITNSRSSADELMRKAVGLVKQAAQSDAKNSPVKVINRFSTYLGRQ